VNVKKPFGYALTSLVVTGIGFYFLGNLLSGEVNYGVILVCFDLMAHAAIFHSIYNTQQLSEKIESIANKYEDLRSLGIQMAGFTKDQQQFFKNAGRDFEFLHYWKIIDDVDIRNGLEELLENLPKYSKNRFLKSYFMVNVIEETKRLRNEPFILPFKSAMDNCKMFCRMINDIDSGGEFKAVTLLTFWSDKSLKNPEKFYRANIKALVRGVHIERIIVIDNYFHKLTKADQKALRLFQYVEKDIKNEIANMDKLSFTEEAIKELSESFVRICIIKRTDEHNYDTYPEKSKFTLFKFDSNSDFSLMDAVYYYKLKDLKEFEVYLHPCVEVTSKIDDFARWKEISITLSEYVKRSEEAKVFEEKVSKEKSV